MMKMPFSGNVNGKYFFRKNKPNNKSNKSLIMNRKIITSR